MGRDKKGKGKAIEEPAAKKQKLSKDQKEAKRAEMAARAAEERERGRGGSLRIRESRQRQQQQTEQTEETEQPLVRRRTVRTRGGHPPAAQSQRPSAAELREERAAERAVYEMDTNVRVGEGVRLTDYRKMKAKQLRKLRWSILLEEWFPQPREPLVDSRFWTLTQASLYETYRRRGHKLFQHNFIDWDQLALAANTEIRPFFERYRGLVELMSFQRSAFVEDWVRVFFATLYVSEGRRSIDFMFMGQHHHLTRQTLGQLLGVDLHDTCLHEIVYGEADPPRRPLTGGVAPPFEEIRSLFAQPFTPDQPRVPALLTPAARTVHLALRRTLLPRSGYLEGFTSLQQTLLFYVMNGMQFDIVDIIICEMEDVITDGVGMMRQLVFGHWISYLLYLLAPEGSAVRDSLTDESVTRFGHYRAPAPGDRRLGRPVERQVRARLSEEDWADLEKEDEILAQAEAQGGDLQHIWSESDTSDSVEEYFPPPPSPRQHDAEAGGSTAPPPPTPPPVSEAQVSQPSELTSLLQQMVEQQRQDRLAAEQARAEQAARLVELQQQQQEMQRQIARERREDTDRLTGLIDQMHQRTLDQQQQTQQAMMGILGLITNLYTQTGIALPTQLPGLAPGAPGLAPASAPVPTTPIPSISMSPLFAPGAPIHSPLPATTLFQQTPASVVSAPLPAVSTQQAPPASAAPTAPVSSTPASAAAGSSSITPGDGTDDSTPDGDQFVIAPSTQDS